MKKISLFLTFVLLLTMMVGCSALEKVTDSVTYVTEATDYLNEMSTLSNTLPALLQESVTNEQKRIELETTLKNTKEEMLEFNSLTPPGKMETLHNKVVEVNQKAIGVIDIYLENIKNGKFNQEVINKNPLMKEILDITNLVNEIKKLGQ